MNASTRAGSHPFQCPSCLSFSVRPLPNAGNEALMLCLRCHETFVFHGATAERTTADATRATSPARSGT
ncbi:MAG: hypothetical protein EHM55_14895 [Acidobacteria bacterium]|nr:MAG: hypothetical protein EHM55_14895 [Acidobacteriota bacterium]